MSSNEPADEPADGPESLRGSRRFLTRSEVAEELNVTEAQVYALLRRGELRAIRVGGRKTYRIARQDLEAYIQTAYADTEKWLREHPFADDEDPDQEDDEEQGTASRA